ncbi:hypothetical protein D1007_12437 [Hordeum vulgare]|uniref:Uncharacterized protein n=1 Tax=Hordeum vulgare subsp. vulgare TaxID=112509 RepID=A0A8I6WDT2_HORVV|nr:uncharacterized protein LOC123444083 [Hordeum vulgare subsp. vulgare]KAE8810821.1 hypothetical protein D1007_12437 [Hordeum vulgare]
MEALAPPGGKPARARRVARNREEMLGLLADFDGGDDSNRELSFSDLVDPGHASPSPPPAPALAHKGREEAAEQRREEAPATKRQQAAAVAGKERRLHRRRSDNRGSCGGGADGNGVLLNFYVPCLLTRSMTAPRPGRGVMPAAGARPSAPPMVAAGKTRMQASLDIGCWPALWGRGRDHHHRSKPA